MVPLFEDNILILELEDLAYLDDLVLCLGRYFIERHQRLDLLLVWSLVLFFIEYHDLYPVPGMINVHSETVSYRNEPKL